MALRLQFQTIMKGNLFVEDYMLQVKMISDHLAIIWQSILDQDLVFNILGGLDSNWNSFISCITLRVEPISFYALYSHMLSYKRFLDHQHQVSTIIQANIAQFGNLNIKPHNSTLAQILIKIQVIMQISLNLVDLIEATRILMIY